MKKFIAACLIGASALLLHAESSQPQTMLSDILKAALDEIGSEYGRNFTVVFGNFTFGESGIAGPFSRYLQDQLSEAVLESPLFDLVVLNALDNLDPAFEKAFGSVFKAEQASALIRGNYTEVTGQVVVDLEVISLTDGTLIGKKKVMIDKTLIPAREALLPDNYGKALAVGQAIADVLPAQPADFSVKVSTNRGNGGVYRDGEELTISFFSSRDAYVKLYHIDVNGATKLIFPNQYHKDNFIRAGTMTVIPDQSYTFRFVLGPPFGTEYIKVIASTEPFTEVETSFEGLGPASRGLLTRGLTVTSKRGSTAEALLSYTIMEK